MVALTAQAQIHTGLPPAGLQAWARSKVSWLYHQIGANPSPSSLKKGISTPKLHVLIPSSGKGENEQSRKEGALPQGQQALSYNPLLFQFYKPAKPHLYAGRKKKKKSPCHPLTCPSGKPVKIHLCKQKQKGAAKSPRLFTGHTGIWDEPKCQRTIQRERKMHLQKRVQGRGQCRGGIL